MTASVKTCNPASCWCDCHDDGDYRHPGPCSVQIPVIRIDADTASRFESTSEAVRVLVDADLRSIARSAARVIESDHNGRAVLAYPAGMFR